MSLPEIELLLDRLLSASTPSDCRDSLDSLLKAASADNESSATTIIIDAILENPPALSALCHLISSSSLGGLKVDGGEVAAAELILALFPVNVNADTNNHGNNNNNVGGATTTAQLQQRQALKRRGELVSKSLLHFHRQSSTHDLHHDQPLKEVSLISSLLDCLCPISTESVSSSYARVLCLQILTRLLQSTPGVLREELMSETEGVNRLVDLLGGGSLTDNNDTDVNGVPEEVRNAAILFLTNLASTSSVLARLITFSEGYSRCLKLCLSDQDQHYVSIDCLNLCLALATNDEVARELFLGGGDGRGNLDMLGMLMDLRRGERFRSVERNEWWDGEMRRRAEKSQGGGDKGEIKSNVGSGSDAAKGGTKEEKKGKKGKRKDDLDDILSGAEATTPPVTASTTSVTASNNAPTPTGPPVPYLTPNESTIISLICSLLLVLLYDGEPPSSSTSSPNVNETTAQKRRIRAKEILSHTLLTQSIVDCALYTLPPPGVDYVSAVPGGELQRKALVVMAVLGSLGDTVNNTGSSNNNNETGGNNLDKTSQETEHLQSHLLFETMPLYLQGRVSAMERLMYLACTGAYRPSNYEHAESEASLISLHAITAFRSCTSSQVATRMVLHALAPPPPDGEEEMLEMPVVTKLVTTLVENARFLHTHLQPAQDKDDEGDGTAIYSATIGAAGAAHALGVLLTKGEGDATREMLLRMPLPPEEEGVMIGSNLIDFALQFVALYDPADNSTFQSSYAHVTLALLRLLSEWIEGMPKAVLEVLSSPSSVCLGVLVRARCGAVSAMSGLLLGLCLDYISEVNDVSNVMMNVENSAWTKETIVNMIQSMGVAKYFGMLDGWKKKAFPLPYCSGEEGPYLELRAASSWYGQSVTQVRRRIVATLAGDGGENEHDSDGEGEEHGESNASTRSLRKMVKSQAKEMEELQSRLDEALHTIETQSAQIKSLKRVTELGSSAEASDLLEEYGDKINELEKEKVQIANDAEKQSNLFKDELSGKDQEIASLQEELQQARLAIEEGERDKEVLGEEMAGLSAAYNSLEQEYRSNSVHSSAEATDMTAGGEAAAEGGSSTPSVPGGEAPAESPGRINHQLQLMQNENAQLREDVRAAQEWMNMAMSKMDEMGQENQSLTASLEEARNQPVVPSSDLQAKDDEIAQQKLVLKELQDRNEEAQEWMASAVSRVDALMKEVEDLKSRNVELEASTGQHETMNSELEEIKAQNASLTAECQTLQGNLTEFQSWSETAQNRLAEMEAALHEVTAERDELKNMPQSPSDDVSAKVESLQADLIKKSDELNDAREQLERIQSQLIEESDANEAIVENLRSELDQQKRLAETLTSERTKETDLSKDRVSELEIALQEVTAERDELKQSVQSLSINNNEHNESLVAELKEKTEQLDDARSQLEQVQSQLIEESDTNEEAMENLRNELSQEKFRLEALAMEKEELVVNLSSKQSEVENAQTENASLNAQIQNLNQSIVELDAAKKAAELHAEDLMKLSSAPESSNLEDEIIAITADRNEIKSHFDDLSEEYEQTRQALERVQMENGNLLARNRALEQDNKSLEFQYSEASAKSTELTQLVESSQEEKASFQQALDEMRNTSEEAVKLWKERAEELESNIALLETQLKEQEEEAVEAIAQWEARCSSLEGNGEEVVQQWQERAQSLEAEVATLSERNNILENSVADAEKLQLEMKEKDEVIASYDEQIDVLTKELVATREESGQVVKQWQERTEQLEVSINELNQSLSNQQTEASEAISQWEARCETYVASSQKMQSEIEEKDKAIASYDEQLDLLTKELIATREESEQVVKQWQDRSEELEVSINEQQAEATDVISQWESRCASLNERIEELECQLVSKDPVAEQLQENLAQANSNLAEKEKNLASLKSEISSLKTAESQKESQISSLLSQLEDTRGKVDRASAEYELLRQTLSHKEAEKDTALNESKTTIDGLNAKAEELQRKLAEAKDLLALKEKEQRDNEMALNARIAEFENNEAKSSQNSVYLQGEFEQLKKKCSSLESKLSMMEKAKEEADHEAEESSRLIHELQQELRLAQDELQTYATDQLSARASEIANHALRESMLQVRAEYEADRKALATEKQARLVAEEEVKKLKSDLALLSQATEYDDNVDMQVRKIAKKMSAENTRKERREMEELRSSLEQLKEELGTCRWKEREAEEKAANARLQKSILEQEVCAAKSDMASMEQAIEDLETSKIEMSVSMDYRIKTLLDERTSLEKSFQEDFASVKAQLARVNQEKDSLIHRLEQSEKANAALTRNTIAGEESESEVVRLQLERAQLMAKITDIGVDSERRVREAVAANASSAEAELIIEKQAKQSLECTLADALSELEDVKSQLIKESPSENNSDNEIIVTELRESLADLQLSYRELQATNEELKEKMNNASEESQSLIGGLRDKLHETEARLREEERVNRYETALASEIAQLRVGVQKKQTMSPGVIIEDEKESVSENVLAMHDYVVYLRELIEKERKIHQAALSEGDEALAVLGTQFQGEE